MNEKLTLLCHFVIPIETLVSEAPGVIVEQKRELDRQIRIQQARLALLHDQEKLTQMTNPRYSDKRVNPETVLLLALLEARRKLEPGVLPDEGSTTPTIVSLSKETEDLLAEAVLSGKIKLREPQTQSKGV